MNINKLKYLLLCLPIITGASCQAQTTPNIDASYSPVLDEISKLENPIVSENSSDDSHALKFSFPFNITNNELNVLVTDLYEKSKTEEQFNEALNELSFATQNEFSESDIDVLKHCRKLSVELHCPNDISLFSQLEQLESLSICEGVETAFVSTEKSILMTTPS